MKKIIALGMAIILITGCQPAAPVPQGLKVLAVESFLADMAQQITGERLQVESLIPLGVDPHSFELTPAGCD